ncbi:acetyl/propionyl/methylcrotonyl-CoA carboxylase subunit alpha [Photobacterium alginatilyticum]|uniref:ATP-grasp domain-containing protein n=1 Tax=Photobacterium alginatilyticum TaxID=1775171 RepID=A0ABW9YFX3_9GAMM|nr:biotin carboxylase N-terminal domain-containing protein [Photobacterium alginatilyticum]NBI52191.1 ATP-grasp domain-containing protein [Photobacterium alginatilyticum]
MSKITDDKVISLANNTGDSLTALNEPRDISRILIANRGEIACRVIETAQKMGIETIAIYSEADRLAKHVSMADHAILVGEAPAANSYLNIARIIQAAKTLEADAIHPGYGFLSENASFAEACLENDLIFIGPPSSAMKAMSSKSDAKSIMEQAHVPLIPGYHGDDNSVETLTATANQIGYPVLLKAALGGGGKGMRIVESAHEMPEAIASAKRESTTSFGDDLLLIEKYLVEPRHIEVQMFADQYGNAIYLSDRDCSIQRRHQKIVEEAPAPNLPATLRHAMGQAAVDAAKAIGYIGAGTVEFLLDASGKFYFMEMNTRLQVEHPVTELITRQDLVEWQINIAKGIPLPLSQSEIIHQGHAMEVRIYAEDPNQDFLPSSGHIHHLSEPEKNSEQTIVRVDSGIQQGDTVTSHYDPMLSKLIVWAATRNSATLALSQALANYRLIGPATNIDYLQRVINHPAFKNADLTTHFIEHHQAELISDHAPGIELKVTNNTDSKKSGNNSDLLTISKLSLFAAISSIHREGKFTHWRLNQPSSQEITVSDSHGEHFQFVFQFPGISQPFSNTYTSTGMQIQLVQVASNDRHCDLAAQVIHLLSITNTDGGNRYQIEVNGQKEHFTHIESNEEQHIYYQTWHDNYFIGNDTDHVHLHNEEENQAIAPLNGIITALLCQPGDNVDKDQPLLVIEAMKMEYTVRAPYKGRVSKVLFALGDQVDHGELLVRIDPEK